MGGSLSRLGKRASRSKKESPPATPVGSASNSALSTPPRGKSGENRPSSAKGKLESFPDVDNLDGCAEETSSEGNIVKSLSADEGDDRFAPVKRTDSIVSAPEEAFSYYTNKLTIQDFELLKVLGKGSFGKVMLVRRCDENCPEGERDTLYALKTLRKATLIARNQLAHTSTERLILQEIYSPFLVHLVYAFQTADKLYMVLDYVGGGELFFWLRKEKRFSEDRCRLYAAEIGLALDAMHKENIVYRDLKPENVLLDSMGHVKLTDFGLAKGEVYTADGERGTKTFCGTPEYLAPEIIENKGHGIAVDWWALGTLLYEMLLGLPPFYDSNIHKMYTKILHDPLRFPKAENRQISNDAKGVLRRFLERKISQRLGSDGINEDMQNVKFFEEQDFEAVYNHEIAPGFCPPSSVDATDASNFDEDFTKEAPVDSVVTNRMTTSMERKSAFQGFTYVTGNTPETVKEQKGVNKGGGKGRAKVIKETSKSKSKSKSESESESESEKKEPVRTQTQTQTQGQGQSQGHQEREKEKEMKQEQEKDKDNEKMLWPLREPEKRQPQEGRGGGSGSGSASDEERKEEKAPPLPPPLAAITVSQPPGPSQEPAGAPAPAATDSSTPAPAPAPAAVAVAVGYAEA